MVIRSQDIFCFLLFSVWVVIHSWFLSYIISRSFDWRGSVFYDLWTQGEEPCKTFHGTAATLCNKYQTPPIVFCPFFRFIDFNCNYVGRIVPHNILRDPIMCYRAFSIMDGFPSICFLGAATPKLEGRYPMRL